VDEIDHTVERDRRVYHSLVTFNQFVIADARLLRVHRKVIERKAERFACSASRLSDPVGRERRRALCLGVAAL
jgi:hypothetical protein